MHSARPLIPITGKRQEGKCLQQRWSQQELNPQPWQYWCSALLVKLQRGEHLKDAMNLLCSFLRATGCLYHKCAESNTWCQHTCLQLTNKTRKIIWSFLFNMFHRCSYGCTVNTSECRWMRSVACWPLILKHFALSELNWAARCGRTCMSEILLTDRSQEWLLHTEGEKCEWREPTMDYGLRLKSLTGTKLISNLIQL